MSYNEEKLLNFKNIIFTDLEYKIKNIKEEKLKLENEIVKQTENQTINQMLPYIEKEIKNFKKKYKQKLTKEILETKKSLLNFRNGLIEKVIELLKQEILYFTKSEDYKMYLKTIIEQTIEEYNLKKVDIHIRKEEFYQKDDILSIKEVNSVFVDKINSLGGFKLVDLENEVEIDETFDAKLTQYIDEFHKECALGLKFF